MLTRLLTLLTTRCTRNGERQDFEGVDLREAARDEGVSPEGRVLDRLKRRARQGA